MVEIGRKEINIEVAGDETTHFLRGQVGRNEVRIESGADIMALQTHWELKWVEQMEWEDALPENSN